MMCSLKFLTKKGAGWLVPLTVALLACSPPEAEDVSPEDFPDPVDTVPGQRVPSEHPVTGANLALIRSELAKAVNKARSIPRRCGGVSYPAVAPLAMHNRLNSAAQAHANDMVANDFYSHVGSDNSLPWMRITRAGYMWSETGENIMAGTAYVSLTMLNWLTSPVDCANIMSNKFTEMGFGYQDGPTTTHRYYWVHNLAKPR